MYVLYQKYLLNLDKLYVVEKTGDKYIDFRGGPIVTTIDFRSVTNRDTAFSHIVDSIRHGTIHYLDLDEILQTKI